METLTVIGLSIVAIILIIGIVRILFNPYTGFFNLLTEVLLMDLFFSALIAVFENIGDIFDWQTFDSAFKKVSKRTYPHVPTVFIICPVWCVSGQWRMMLVSVGETPVANRRTMVQFHSSSLKKKLQQVLWEWKFLRTFAGVLWNKGSGPFYMVIDQSIVIPWWCSWQTMSKPRK